MLKRIVQQNELRIEIFNRGSCGLDVPPPPNPNAPVADSSSGRATVVLQKTAQPIRALDLANSSGLG